MEIKIILPDDVAINLCSSFGYGQCTKTKSKTNIIAKLKEIIEGSYLRYKINRDTNDQFKTVIEAAKTSAESDVSNILVS